MEAYLTQIVNAPLQLEDIGAKLDDGFLAVLMLNGLPESFNSLVMASEHPGAEITTVVVRLKLLQEKKRNENSESSSA